jgi:hypothetical protein
MLSSDILKEFNNFSIQEFEGNFSIFIDEFYKKIDNKIGDIIKKSYYLFISLQEPSFLNNIEIQNYTFNKNFNEFIVNYTDNNIKIKLKKIYIYYLIQH